MLETYKGFNTGLVEGTEGSSNVPRVGGKTCLIRAPAAL